MLKQWVMLGFGTSLLLLTLGASSFAATVRVTDAALEPDTVMVNRGEEIVWVDATSSRSAQVDVALQFSEQAWAKITLDKDGNVRASFEKPGSYEYHGYVGVGGLQPRPIRGRIVVK